MIYDKGMRTQDEVSKGINYVYYVTDMEELPSAGHFRKMDAGREIAWHISEGLENSQIKKYTEYEGEFIEACSVGIVFPTHMWGVSLAVYTFLKHLKISDNTYVYAVVVGESLSACVDATLNKRLNSLERFKRIFMDRDFGGEEDIFVRCIDFARDYDTTEDVLRGQKESKLRLGHIMEGLLYHSLDELKSHVAVPVKKPAETELFVDVSAIRRSSYDYEKRKLSLSNVYLDEDIMQGVRLCRVM